MNKHDGVGKSWVMTKVPWTDDRILSVFDNDGDPVASIRVGSDDFVWTREPDGEDAGTRRHEGTGRS